MKVVIIGGVPEASCGVVQADRDELRPFRPR
jgi:hypothetical protein